jgi:hypothetical protein
LLDSPQRYHWFGRRFVIMPDHLHLIAHMGHDALRLGQWIKALKAVVSGLKPRTERPVEYSAPLDGRVPSPGVPARPGMVAHEFTRIKRAWRWQDSFHDHKFRTPESESRKWEYVCLNPVRFGLVKRPEEWSFGEWSFGGEIFYNETGGPQLIRGTPPLLETGLLVADASSKTSDPPGEGTRPTR